MDGSYFNSNGVMFHSNRPMLIEYYQADSTIAAPSGGAFTVLGGTVGDAVTILDNAGLFGSGADGPGATAAFQSSGAISPGSSGFPGEPGGWNLMFAFVQMQPFSGTEAVYGVAWAVDNVVQTDIGPMQPGDNANQNIGFAVDLVERSPSVTPNYQVVAYAADPNGRSNTILTNTVSTVGGGCRLGEIWCGVLNGAAGTVSSIPSPMTAITTATTLTAATLNTTIQDTFTLLNYPPMLNVQSATAFTTTANSIQTMPFADTPLIDNYNGFNTGTGQYTVRLPGIYFCHANLVFSSGFTAGGSLCGFSVNGTSYLGGAYNATRANAMGSGCAVTKVLDLHAGDVVEVVTNTSTAATTWYSVYSISRWIMTWMCPIASTTQTWMPPDVTGFQFPAGCAPGSPTPFSVSASIGADVSWGGILNEFATVPATTVQQPVGYFAGGAQPASVTSWSIAATVASGDLSLVEIAAGTTATFTVTDNGGNPYTQIASASSGTASQYTFLATVITSPSSVSVTSSNTVSPNSCVYGLHNFGTYVQSFTNTGSGSAATISETLGQAGVMNMLFTSFSSTSVGKADGTFASMAGWSCQNATSTAPTQSTLHSYMSTYSAEVTWNGSETYCNLGAFGSELTPVVPGTQVAVEGWIYPTATNYFAAAFWWYNSDGYLFSDQADGGYITGGEFGQVTYSMTVPDGAWLAAYGVQMESPTSAATFYASDFFFYAYGAVPPGFTGMQEAYANGLNYQPSFMQVNPGQQLAPLMNAKIANDINFLLNRPYCTVHQTTAQSGLAMNAWQPVTMQSTTGLVHGSNGDNYNGWDATANCYVAQRAGWYLAVEEVNAAAVINDALYALMAGFSVPTSGGVAAPTSPYGMPDTFQLLETCNSWTYPTGATGINVYYLLPGETIFPSARYNPSGTQTTWDTDVSHDFDSHFSVIWLSN